MKTSIGYIVPLQQGIYSGNKFPRTRRILNFISFADVLVITDFINTTLALYAIKH